MRKVVFILFVTIFSISCSVIKSRKTVTDNVSTESANEDVMERTINQNITRNGFNIQKAEIDVYTSEGRQKVLGSLKFESPDKYLISIRSRTGIEAARIFISKDTILINDRINKRLYVGSPGYLKRKYGISAAVLPVVLGDVIGGKYSDDKRTDCLDGKLIVNGLIEGVKINYVIDCRKGKLISANPENSLNNDGLNIKYNNFRKDGNSLIPGQIDINDSNSSTTIEIRIIKIESPWTGDVNFIPGNKYEIVKLL